MKAHNDLALIARSYLFVKESGVNMGRWVDFFNRAVNSTTGHAWCAAFVSSCVLENKERARQNYTLVLSEHVRTLYNSNKLKSSKLPSVGTIMCLGAIGSTSGHCGLVVQVNADGSWDAIEGNTSDGTGVNRDGDGVYLRRRRLPLKGFELLGFIDPYK